MRFLGSRAGGALAGACMLALACSGLSEPDYEYEETLSLSLDGSAVVELSASAAALSMLRRAPFPPDLQGPADAAAIEALVEGPGARLESIDWFERSGRPFVTLRVAIEDVHDLSRVPLFAWSLYRFLDEDDRFVIRQLIGSQALAPSGWEGWQGNERVAFRMRLPGEISVHSAPRRPGRGNVLVWEQSLEARLAGAPLDMQASLPKAELLRQPMRLLALTVAGMVTVFGLALWWLRRRLRGVG